MKLENKSNGNMRIIRSIVNQRKMQNIFMIKLEPFLTKYNCIKVAIVKIITEYAPKEIYITFGISFPTSSVIVLNIP